MKSFLLLVIFLFSLPSWAALELERQWSRSTWQKPHMRYRHPNRMTPVLTKNLVIQGNAIDGIKAFERKTGHERWHLQFKNGVEGGAALADGKLYFGANNGQFYCVQAETGKILWSYPIHSESLARPAVVGGKVYHVAANNTLYAFDAQTGRSLWIQSESAKPSMTVRGQTAPVVDEGKLYLGFSDGNFSAFNAETGRTLWSKRIGDDKKFNDVDSTPVITANCILVSSYANALYCLNKASGSIQWRHDVGGFHPVTVENDKIYYPTVAGEIHILDASSGKLLKKIVNIDGLATAVAIDGDKIIYGESEGGLKVRDINNLNVLTSFAPGKGLQATPTIDKSSGEIYFISNDANLFKLKLQEKDRSFPWSL
ncbi:MAG: PQQ-binding-like beta-propeller repeat protein [Bdellovibrionales bacterium]|nr:PQQ-binding-like beta-propeller repeat protein [Bdellovibrionales bacterium]